MTLNGVGVVPPLTPGCNQFAPSVVAVETAKDKWVEFVDEIVSD
jgi:hypothetical protein